MNAARRRALSIRKCLTCDRKRTILTNREVCVKLHYPASPRSGIQCGVSFFKRGFMHDLLSFPSVPATKLAYSKAEATAILGVSLRTIDNLIAHKEITVRRVGRRVLIPLTSMTAFLLRDHCTSMKAAA